LLDSLLIIGDYLPTPQMDGGSLRMFEILKLLRESVGDLVCLPRHSTLPHRDVTMAQACKDLRREGVLVPGGDAPENALAHLRSHTRRYRAVLLSGAYTAHALRGHVRELSSSSALIYDTVDLHHVRLFREAKVSGNSLHLRQALALKKNELANVEASDITLVVTPHEREVLLRERQASEIFILSNIHEPISVKPGLAERKSVIFLGAFKHTPNVDAALYLVREIMPKVWQEDPSAQVEVVGSNPPEEIQKLESETVRVRGYVPDLGPAFSEARLSVAPLRFGAGVKGKVLESMAHGVPAVGTSIAAEGIALRHGENFLRADRAEDLAAQILRLMRDGALWRRLSENGLGLIREEYSRSAARHRIQALLHRLEEIRSEKR
jgi:O-antigen biosynthesis protein